MHFLPSRFVELACALVAVIGLVGPSALAGPTTCPYKTAHDAPLAATFKQVDATAIRTKYRVEFNGIDGDRVPGYLYVPNDKKATHPAALAMYGVGGNKSTNYIVALDEGFAANGFVTLTIDAPDRGERRQADRAAREDRDMAQTMGDYSRAIDYLCSRPDVDKNQVVYTGISWGAITGITFCAFEPRVKAVASIVGGGDFFAAVPMGIAAAARNAIDKFDPVHYVADIEPRPLLLLNATRDQLVLRYMSDALHAKAGPHATKRWLDTDHFFTGVDREKMALDVIQFLQAGLKAEANAQPPQAKK